MKPLRHLDLGLCLGALASEVGVDRRQVAFMGYWRRGVAMKG